MRQEEDVGNVPMGSEVVMQNLQCVREGLAAIDGQVLRLYTGLLPGSALDDVQHKNRGDD